MTDDEALKLQPGDPLLGVISGRLAILEAVTVYPPRPPPHPRHRGANVRVRRAGKTKQGHRFPETVRHADELRRLPRPDAPAFWVAADWLDEHGEERAAALLRRAFPLNGEG